MNTAKIIGGILALVGGGFILLCVIGLEGFLVMDVEHAASWLITTVICGLAIVGGIIGVSGKRSGGAFALSSGVIAIVYGFFTISWSHSYVTYPTSFFTDILHVFPAPTHVFLGISLEAILILAGAICILAGGHEK